MKIFRRVKGIPEPEEPKRMMTKARLYRSPVQSPGWPGRAGESGREQANPQEQVNPEEQANPQELVNRWSRPIHGHSQTGNQSGPEVSDEGNEPEKKTGGYSVESSWK